MPGEVVTKSAAEAISRVPTRPNMVMTVRRTATNLLVAHSFFGPRGSGLSPEVEEWHGSSAGGMSEEMNDTSLV
jgi:hypothetical protein